MSHERPDDNMDDELRDVAIPFDLSARLKQVAVVSDDDIDCALRALAAPSELGSRLKCVVADEQIDELLRDVPLPPAMLARLRIVPVVRPDATFRRFVLAASLLFIMLGSFFGAMGGLLASIRPLPPFLTTLHIIDLGPTRLVSFPTEPVTIARDDSDNLFEVATVPVVWKGGASDVELVRLDEKVPRGVAGQLINDIERGLKLDNDVVLMRWDAYGSPQHASRSMPELGVIQSRADAGVDLPLVGGYDRSFLLRTANHPPVFPAASTKLQTVRVPIVTSSHSLRRAAFEVSKGRTPDPTEIRTEEFVSALDYGFPVPTTDDVSMTMTVGPALFSEQDHSLLQIGVRAAHRLGNRATHLSVVVDVSQSMGQEQRLAEVRQALRKLFAHLSHDDSVSLIAVNHEVTQQLDFATSADRELLDTWLASLRVGGGDDLVLGARTALSLALAAPCGVDSLRQVAVLTDQGGAAVFDTSATSEGLLAEVEREGVQFTVLPLCQMVSNSDGCMADELAWRLVEQATGVSSLVTMDAKFRVSFNAKAVRAYRLVGHGPSAMTGLAGEPIGGDLRSGEQASLLFELWLKDSYEDEIVTARLVGKLAGRPSNPGSSSELARGSLDRYSLTTRADTMSRSVRMAAIAAEVASRLQEVGDFELTGQRRFRVMRKRLDWRNILNEAELVGPPWPQDGEFQRLLELTQGMDLLSRRAATGGPP